MKRKERHHLKENDLAQTILAAREAIEPAKGPADRHGPRRPPRRRRHRRHRRLAAGNDARAEQLLGEAMVAFNARVIPPSATPAQPGEVPAAATLGATGSYATEAAKLNAAAAEAEGGGRRLSRYGRGHHRALSLRLVARGARQARRSDPGFDKVVSRAGNDSLYGRMAQLGKADTQVRAGQLDEAIATWKKLAASTDEDLPKDAILMELQKPTRRGETRKRRRRRSRRSWTSTRRRLHGRSADRTRESSPSTQLLPLLRSFFLTSFNDQKIGLR